MNTEKINDETTDDQGEQPGSTPDAPETTEPEASAPVGQEPADSPGADDADEVTEPDEGADTFDRPYVEKLRAESATYRTRAKELEAKLHRLMVEQTGALADPADLEFDAEHLENPEALQAAIDALLAERPHLKARRFTPGAAAQGARSTAAATVDLAGLMRGAVT